MLDWLTYRVMDIAAWLDRGVWREWQYERIGVMHYSSPIERWVWVDAVHLRRDGWRPMRYV